MWQLSCLRCWSKWLIIAYDWTPHSTFCSRPLGSFMEMNAKHLRVVFLDVFKQHLRLSLSLMLTIQASQRKRLTLPSSVLSRCLLWAPDLLIGLVHYQHFRRMSLMRTWFPLGLTFLHSYIPQMPGEFWGSSNEPNPSSYMLRWIRWTLWFS